MIQKIFLTILAATIFWMLSSTSLAAIQLDPTLKPDNLPDITVQDVTDEEHPERAATQALILFVGDLVSKVLLFTGALIIVFLIVAGANYIFAFGKDERIEKGKRGIFWALIGLVLILLSYALVQGIISIILQIDASAT